MDIERLRLKLRRHAPEPVDAQDHARASVAVVLRQGPCSAEVLLIERALHDRDPWSGHMAFPGGRMEPGDPSTRGTAERETLEEVGLDLAGAEYLGHVDELVGNPRVHPRLVVSAHAFHVADPPVFTLDPREVQNAFWFPLVELHAEHRRIEHVVPEMPQVRFPAIEVGVPGRHVLWGLTFRFLDRLLDVIDHPYAERWGNLGDFVDSAGRPRLESIVQSQPEPGSQSEPGPEPERESEAKASSGSNVRPAGARES